MAAQKTIDSNQVGKIGPRFFRCDVVQRFRLYEALVKHARAKNRLLTKRQRSGTPTVRKGSADFLSSMPAILIVLARCAIIIALDIICPNPGSIEAICGPMFSGKTEELIRRLKRKRIAGKHVQVFHPSIDNRYSVSEIVTHANLRMESEPVDSVEDLLSRVGRRTQVIGIDEGNFFGPALVPAARHLVETGKQVIIAGLDLDYLGRPFPPMPDLLALADSISKMAAICMRCGAPAQHTQRLVESEELIFVGTVDSYEARCRRCFEPGIARQEVFDFTLPDQGNFSASD